MSTSEKKTLSDEIYDYFHDYPKSSLNSRSEIVDGVWVLEAEVARLGDDNARLKRELGEMELDYEDAERGYGLAHKQLAKLREQLAEAQRELAQWEHVSEQRTPEFEDVLMRNQTLARELAAACLERDTQRELNFGLVDSNQGLREQLAEAHAENAGLKRELAGVLEKLENCVPYSLHDPVKDARNALREQLTAVMWARDSIQAEHEQLGGQLAEAQAALAERREAFDAMRLAWEVTTDVIERVRAWANEQLLRHGPGRAQEELLAVLGASPQEVRTLAVTSSAKGAEYIPCGCNDTECPHCYPHLRNPREVDTDEEDSCENHSVWWADCADCNPLCANGNMPHKSKPAERGEVMSKESRNVDTLDSSGYRVDMSDNVEAVEGVEPALSERLEAWYKDSVMHFTSSEEEAEFDVIVTALQEMEKAK